MSFPLSLSGLYNGGVVGILHGEYFLIQGRSRIPLDPTTGAVGWVVQRLGTALMGTLIVLTAVVWFQQGTLSPGRVFQEDGSGRPVYPWLIKAGAVLLLIPLLIFAVRIVYTGLLRVVE